MATETEGQEDAREQFARRPDDALPNTNESLSAAIQLCRDHEEVQLPPGEDGDIDAESSQRPERLHPRSDHQVSHWDPQQVREGHRMCAGQSDTGRLLNIVSKMRSFGMWGKINWIHTVSVWPLDILNEIICIII